MAFQMGDGKVHPWHKDFMKEMVNAPALSWVFMQTWSLHSCGGGIPERNGNCNTGVLQRHPETSLIAAFKGISFLWVWALCVQAGAQYSAGEWANARTDVLNIPN